MKDYEPEVVPRQLSSLPAPALFSWEQYGVNCSKLAGNDFHSLIDSEVESGLGTPTFTPAPIPIPFSPILLQLPCQPCVHLLQLQHLLLMEPD